MNFFVPWLGAGMVYLINHLWPASFQSLFLINIWLFSLPHTFSTFTRSDRRGNRELSLTLGLFVLFFLSVVTLTHVWGLVLVYAIYFYWQQFHYGKQNFGLAHWKGHAPVNWMDRAFYLVTVAMTLFGLFTDGPQNFFGYALDNPLPIYFSKASLILILSTLTASYLIFRPSQWRHALSHVSIFSLAYLACDSFALGWLSLNVFHNLQYLKFMKSYERRLTFLLVPMVLTFGLYLLQFHVVNGLILFAIPFSLGLMLALNFTHYTLDGLIWKKKRVVS